ncbi:MAG: NUDIX hydrolase [Planctomycetaceae bacterium]|nr:NUDIX hydrolase [Planctomycetaceae bacterium]
MSDPEVIARGRFVRLVNDNGWEYAERERAEDVVAVVAVNENNELILTEQFRPAVKRTVIDIPAGLAGDTDDFAGESPATAAARELEEETGYVARSLTEMATVPSSPGLTSETVTIFLAEGLTRQGDGGGDESESIVVHTVPVQLLWEWLRSRESQSQLIDPKVYAGLWLREQYMSASG